MRSYEVARKVLSFLELVSWGVVAIGVILVFVGIEAAPRSSGLLFAAPGMMVGILGLILVAMVQSGRSSVDTAEYTQQILQNSRDQLEVSRRLLNAQKPAATTGFPRSAPTDESKTSPYQDALKPKASSAEPHEAPKRKTLGQTKSPFGYLGRQVRVDDGQYSYDGKSFETAEAVRAHIDTLSNGPSTKQ